MKKSVFLKSTIILIVGGAISKLLGMITKIITTRIVGLEGIGLHMMIMPTFLLFITLSQLGLPIAISKLVSEEKVKSKKLLATTLVIALLFNILIIIFLILVTPVISNLLLRNKDTYFPILSISLTLPFMAISSIIRGYFFGKQRMYPHIISNIIEQLFRLGLIIYITPILLKYGIPIAVSGLVLFNIVSETIAIIILYLYLPKKFKLTKKDLIPSKVIAKDVLDISIPTTSSRIAGSIGYFIEPIILTQILIYIGYSSKYITNEYGIISGFVIQTLLLPSFFTLAISQALIPVISKHYYLGNIKYIKNKIKQSVMFSFGIGLFVTLILISNPKFVLNLLYNTTKGWEYLLILAPFFLIFYIQGPLTSSLQAMNKSKEAFFATLKGIIYKTIILISLSFLKIGMYSLIIATIFNIVYVTIHHFLLVKKTLKNS